MRSLLLTALVLGLVGCVTTSEAAPMKYCGDTKTYVRKNQPCPPAPAPAPEPAPAPAPTTEPAPSPLPTTDPAPLPGTDTPTPTTDTAPTPTPEPLPSPDPTLGYVVAPSIAGSDPIPDGLVVANYLNDITKYGPTASAAPDVVGAFRFVCYDAQALNDDPIVYPGEPGKAHRHRFYGNTGANANSTYQSLRTSGESSCKNILNRSAYWTTDLCDDLYCYRADHEQIYYKRRPASDPKCNPEVDPNAEGKCIAIPRNIRFIFGYDMVTGRAPTGSVYFMCSSGTWTGVTVSVADSSHKLNPGGFQKAIDICPVGARVSATLKAPDCWDGKYLDVPNHRDHVSYKLQDTNTGVLKCPPGFPYVIPGFTHTRVWNVTQELKAAGDAKKLRFSSDEMLVGSLPGDTYHGDYWNAWNDEVLAMWIGNCIDKMLNCADGVLGNGYQLKELAKAKYVGLPQREPRQ